VHNERILKKNSENLDEIIYRISECEKGNINIWDALYSPVSNIPFQRLN